MTVAMIANASASQVDDKAFRRSAGVSAGRKMVAMAWKKGRGKLGPMAPLLGRWKATADSPMGAVTCLRSYEKFGEAYVRLEAEWHIGKFPQVKPCREVCLFGPADDGVLAFWSYTNDGKKSSGRLSSAPEINAQSVCFEADMGHGIARQVFWPDGTGGMHWIVDAKTKKGWSRLASHHYRAV
jgi:hypothetical protein